jgi:hypothetical protein
LGFLHRISDVTFEGPFSQARELLSRTPDAAVRIASRGSQTYNASNGGAFAETIIREFFGYQPDLLSHSLAFDTRTRGFEGQLLNVRQGNRLYTITSGDGGHKDCLFRESQQTYQINAWHRSPGQRRQTVWTCPLSAAGRISIALRLPSAGFWKLKLLW